MKTVVIKCAGGPEVLQIVQRPKPKITAGEILIKVKAIGLNRPDIFQRMGNYAAPDGVVADIPGLEVAGIVEEVSESSGRWKIGDKVCALLAGGGYAEYAKAPDQQCLPVPKNFSFEEAASLPETFFTVWSNVFDRAAFAKGQTVLVHGGTSGIGVACIQMVKAMGGEVYATAGTNEKCAFAEGLGSKKAINYNQADFEDKLGRNSVDIVLDMVGGEYTAKNINILKAEGTLVIINAIKGRMAEIDLMKVMMKRLIITGSTLRSRDNSFKAKTAQHLEKHVWPLLDNGQIKPIVYKVLKMEEAAEAHRLMESSEHIGKIILTTD